MAFRNPLRHLPASGITGQITSGQIATGAVGSDQLSVGANTSIGQKWYDAGAEASRWTATLAAPTSVQVPDAQTGGYVMRATGYTGACYRADVKIPYDPGVLYRVTGVVRQTASNSTPGTNQSVYIGLAGWAADGVTLVNRTGAASASTQHYVAASQVPLTTGGGWQRFTGYVKGWAATGSGAAAPSPLAPGVMHQNVRYVSPIVFLNYNGGSGTAELGLFTVEVVETGSVGGGNIAADAIDGKTVTGATVQTAASGQRIVLAPDGKVSLYTGDPSETSPAKIWADPSPYPGLNFLGPKVGTNPPAGLVFWTRPDGTQEYALGDFRVTRDGVTGADSMSLFGGRLDVGTVAVDSMLTAGNMAWGSTVITPVANTDTSVAVTGVGLISSATSYRVWLLANSAAPGQINAVTATGATADGFTLWINRTTATATNVWWLMLAK